jgi:hypothetical protein
VTVRRAIKLKHLLAAEHTVLPAANNMNRFCHDDTNPAAGCNISAMNGANSIPEMAKAGVEGFEQRLNIVEGPPSGHMLDAKVVCRTALSIEYPWRKELFPRCGKKISLITDY